jgi:hypothetical protein
MWVTVSMLDAFLLPLKVFNSLLPVTFLHCPSPCSFSIPGLQNSVLNVSKYLSVSSEEISLVHQI